MISSDTVKTTKKKNHKLKKMQMMAAAAFRFAELCMFLAVFWRISGHLNAGVLKLSGGYGYCIRILSDTLISPRFVFLVGNAIFLVLLRRSGREKQGSGGNLDLYEERLKQSGTMNQEFCHEEQGKKKKKQGNYKMQRSRSEEGRKRGGRGEELKRSATVSRGKREAGAPATEEMSSEEFRRKVEDFIARQRMALMEEECSFFVSKCTDQK